MTDFNQNGAYRDTGLQEQSEKQKGLNKAITTIKDMIYKVGSSQIGGVIAVVVIALIISSVLTIERSAVGIDIKQGDIIDVPVGQQKVSLLQSLFIPSYKKGVYRVYVEARESNTNEIVLIKTIDEVGDDNFITIPNIPVPIQKGSWNLVADLKYSNNTLIDRNCLEVFFQNGKITSTTPTRCK